MDAMNFDRMIRAFSDDSTRRGLLQFLAALPLVGGLAALFPMEDAEGRGRRRRRKKPHHHRKKSGNRAGKKKKRRCNNESKAKTCAGTCGLVKNNCRKTVDCGSCACDPTCDACFTCQEGPNTPGECVVDSAQQGDACGDPGQICQDDGSCACSADTCPSETPNCTDGVCVCDATSCPVGQCCGLDGNCGPCLVFVTSTSSTGNLGGLSGADQTCQNLAKAADLPGPYKAWLSDSTASASARLVHATVPYQMRNGTVVANDWADLTDGSLQNGINLNEAGNPGGGSVWAGTTTSGSYSGASCGDWTVGSGGSGDLGNVGDTNSGWTDVARRGCSLSLALYCFQQS